uniref:Uncharacterized protein n=1 Tax=Molossus molossus TaxID=27622 RepID=A0A7J8JX77_MOLMO|nr:hypothetical protein HJG59_007781 [Molossus molossus]
MEQQIDVSLSNQLREKKEKQRSEDNKTVTFRLKNNTALVPSQPPWELMRPRPQEALRLAVPGSSGTGPASTIRPQEALRLGVSGELWDRHSINHLATGGAQAGCVWGALGQAQHQPSGHRRRSGWVCLGSSGTGTASTIRPQEALRLGVPGELWDRHSINHPATGGAQAGCAWGALGQAQHQPPGQAHP